MGVIAWVIIGWLATQILGGRGGLLYNLAARGRDRRLFPS